MHKGYVKGKGKGASEKFKDAPLRTFDEVQEFDSYGGIISDGWIVVDIDTKEQAEILMQIVEDLQLDCRVYQTTKGMHFMFRCLEDLRCKTGTKLACGLTADIKTSGNYHCLKCDGVERPIIYDINEGEEYKTVLPKWLLPVNTNIDLFGLSDGDGRDSALYSYILTLTSNGFSKEESRECISLINKYIFKDKLSDDDIERITRDEAFPDDLFFEKGKFQHHKFGDYMISECHIKRINGQLHIYRDGIYVSGNKYIDNLMIKKMPSIKAQNRVEVLKYLEGLMPDDIDADMFEHLIAFNNGVLDIRTGELLPFSPEYIITNKIPWNYNPSAYDELMDKTLNKISCNDKEIRMLLEECSGYCLLRKNDLETSFILTGSGANGKSTFLETLSAMLGKNNISHLDIAELDDRFSTVMMSGKLANIGDDISDEFIGGKTIATFKKIVSSNAIKGEHKGQDGFFFKPYTKLLFSANTIPRMKANGFQAIKRRIKIIPFNATFTKNDADFDSGIKWKLRTQNAIEYFIVISLEGLKRAIEQDGFTESSKVVAEVDKFEVENNPVLSWLEEIKEKEELTDVLEYIERTPVNEMYLNYSIYCNHRGFKETSNSEFSKQLQRRFNLTTKRRTIKSKKYTFLCPM